MDTIVGDELDGRLYTDLSNLRGESPLTPISRFYIRSRASHLLPPAEDWNIRVRSGRRSFFLAAAALVRAAKPMGAHVLECAGNTRAAHFGMIGATDWTGVSVADVLDEFQITGNVLVSGFDVYREASRSSSAGASWIFPDYSLRQSAAFFATHMGSQPLTRDHGAPVRLVVPGWYGCCCIKWVNAIEESGEKMRATSQMIEYAQRTNQAGVPRLASEYRPASIDLAAMPVRVEKWRIGGQVQYRIVGVAWGGAAPVKSLLISFGPDDQYVPVVQVQPAAGFRAIWSHWWKPLHRGVYQIQLRPSDASIQARRMNPGYYTRLVEISEN
ncbi:MAG TPA: molybdopterin-dependent oxidoreductase [Bryobacteraceae bacterium]|jgi:DMSO/TMAO reductase YedYZ molybdopterin-dependent catalytic subunit|nr:molybdopterin-dependent oxidoreductase [Bryobacteraceae bacterium]